DIPSAVSELVDDPYQPVAEVLLRSGRVGGNGHDQDGKRVARRGDKDDRGGLLGADETETGQRSRSRLSRGSDPDQQPHQDAEIVPGDVDQISFVNIFASAH